MKLILSLYVINGAWCLVACESFLYEKMHNFGLGKRVIQNYRRMFEQQAHPDPLPTPRRAAYIRSPYRNIYQGVRRKGDKRVYNNRFDYAEKVEGQKVFCRGDFPCIINHIAVETDGGIPTLLRGGAGYRHFVVLVRSGPGVRLTGRVRAYCFNYTSEELI